jgi:hypothetical protein
LRLRLSSASDRTLQASDVFVTFLCLYLLSSGRGTPADDAIAMWQSAQHLVRHGTFAIDFAWPVNAPAGPDGRFYPVAALLAILIHVPGAALEAALNALAPGRGGQFVAITSRLGPLIVGAAVPAFFFRLLLRLGHGRGPAAWTTLLLGVGTTIWVYARLSYAEILQAACFLLFFGALLEAARAPGPGSLARWGLAAGLLLNTKNIYLGCLPGALVFLVARLPRGPERRRLLAWAGLGFLPGVLALGFYGWVRWGSPFATGYEGVTHGFWRESLLWGLWGQLLSPGKSVFLYSPPLILALCGLPRFLRRQREVGWAIALTVGPVVLIYARYLFWSGDWGWGPRYLVFAVPVLLLPAAELFGPPAAGTELRRRAVKLGAWAALLGGAAVQLLGGAFGWDDFIRISHQAQMQWLGTPDLRGTALAPYECVSCLEDMYPIDWLPAMQPIAGHLWLLRHKVARSDARTAEADAPWRRYTSLRLDIEASYSEAQIDWWWLGTAPELRLVAGVSALLLLFAIPVRPWRGALAGGGGMTRRPPAT